MSYKRGTLGYQKWGVTNPWVFANYGQPQRMRGYVSPMVFQTAGPFLKSAHLGEDAADELKRAERMEKIAIAGLALSGASLWLGYQFYKERQVAKNRRRRDARNTSRRPSGSRRTSR